MRNQESPQEDPPRLASLMSVYELAGELNKCTGDPGEPKDYESLTTEEDGGHKLSTVISWLLGTILGLPPVKTSFQEGVVLAEVESLYTACEIFELWQERFARNPSNLEVQSQLKIAMLNMGMHARRFRTLARSVIDV